MVATCLQAYQHARSAGDSPAGLDSIVAFGAPHGYSGPEGFDVSHVGEVPRERPKIGVEH